MSINDFEQLKSKIEKLERYDIEQNDFGLYEISRDDNGDYLEREDVLEVLPTKPLTNHFEQSVVCLAKLHMMDRNDQTETKEADNLREKLHTLHLKLTQDEKEVTQDLSAAMYQKKHRGSHFPKEILAIPTFQTYVEKEQRILAGERIAGIELSAYACHELDWSFFLQHPDLPKDLEVLCRDVNPYTLTILIIVYSESFKQFENGTDLPRVEPLFRKVGDKLEYVVSDALDPITEDDKSTSRAKKYFGISAEDFLPTTNNSQNSKTKPQCSVFQTWIDTSTSDAVLSIYETNGELIRTLVDNIRPLLTTEHQTQYETYRQTLINQTMLATHHHGLNPSWYHFITDNLAEFAIVHSAQPDTVHLF